MSTYSLIAHNFTPPAATTSSQLGGGAIALIKSIDASSDNTISFQDGSSGVTMDSTYKTYIFKFTNIHPTADGVNLTFQVNASGGSNFDETITSTAGRCFNEEDDSSNGFGVNANADQAQGTSFNRLTSSCGGDNDQSCSGELYIFNPSNTNFVTHFISNFNNSADGDFTFQQFYAGYINTASAIDEIQFKFNSGDIGSGTIAMYGIA